MTTLKGLYFIKNVANGAINAEPHAQRPNPVGIRVVSNPAPAVWVIEPVPDPGPWPLYKIFLAPQNHHLQSGTPAKESSPISLGLKPANEVKESLFVVNGVQPDYWFIFPLKPLEPNVYAIFRRPQLEAHYWLLPSSNPGTQVSVVRTDTHKKLIADYGVEIPEYCRWEVTPVPLPAS